MEIDIRKYLHYIKESIESINSYLGKNRFFSNYQNDKVDDEIVWGTIVRHLPTLHKEITKLLNK